MIVSSNTLVNNLNADLLDGYHQSSFLRADGVNQYVTLSGGDGNNEGYRLVFEGTVTGGWSINSMTLLVNSRHAGTGMISIVFHTTNQESTSYVGSLNYYGSILALGYTMWRLFYNTTTKKVRLFWRFYDYSDCKVSILNSVVLLQIYPIKLGTLLYRQIVAQNFHHIIIGLILPALLLLPVPLGSTFQRYG